MVAGISFFLPAVLIVTGFAWAYVRYGSLPQVTGILYRVKPVIIAAVLQVLWRLGRADIKTRFLAAVGIAGVALTFFGINELVILFGGGMMVGAGRLVVQQNQEWTWLSFVDLGIATRYLFAIRHNGGDSLGVRPIATVPILPQGWRRAVRQRLRAARLPPR